MANQLYAKGKQALLNGTMDLDTHTIRAFLVDTASYTANFSTDQYISSISTGARVGNNGATGRADGPQLTSITVTDGTFDAGVLTFTAIPGTVTYEAIVIYRDDGAADASSPLLCYIDTGTGLPITSNGSDIQVTFHASGIFTLS